MPVVDFDDDGNIISRTESNHVPGPGDDEEAWEAQPLYDETHFALNKIITPNWDVNEANNEIRARNSVLLGAKPDVETVPVSAPTSIGPVEIVTPKEPRVKPKESVVVPEVENDVAYKRLELVYDLHEVKMKAADLKGNQTHSPVVMIADSGICKLLAYNAEGKQPLMNTRPSIKKPEVGQVNLTNTLGEPINWLPMHTRDGIFNLATRDQVKSNLVVINSDGCKEQLNYRDDSIFDPRLNWGFALSQIAFNYRQMNQRSIDEENGVDPRLSASLAWVSAESMDKIVFRREYHLHYDEALHIRQTYMRGEYKVDEVVYQAIGKLLATHPAFIGHNDVNHKYPTLITVVFDLLVDPGQLISSIVSQDKGIYGSTFIAPFIEKALFIGDKNEAPSWDQLHRSIDRKTQKALQKGPMDAFSGISVVKEGARVTFYYKVGNEIHAVKSCPDASRADGVYVYSSTKEDLQKAGDNPKVITPTYYPLEEAQKNGFYRSKQDCVMEGNLEAATLKHVEQTKLTRAETDLYAIQENRKVVEGKLANELKAQETVVLKQNLEIESLKEKLNFEAGKHSYEMRSYDRKDTSETIKFIPVLAAGVVSVAAIISAVLIKGSIIAGAVAGAAATGPVIVGILTGIGLVYAVQTVGKKIVRLTVRAIGGTKNAVCAVGRGLGHLGGAIADGVGSAVEFVGDVCSSGISAISSGVSAVGECVSDFCGSAYRAIFW